MARSRPGWFPVRVTRFGRGQNLPVAVLIGTSGWQYQDWRGRFYPEGLPTGGQLAHYAAALRCFPDGTRVAVECRHPSWFVEDVRRVLEAAGAAWVLVDPAPRERPAWRTAGWGYVRFHRGRGSPSPCYTPAQLERWAEALAGEWSLAETVYCYFNNDPLGCAPRDARRFASCVSRAGLVPSSVPGPRSTPLARPARRAR